MEKTKSPLTRAHTPPTHTTKKNAEHTAKKRKQKENNNKGHCIMATTQLSPSSLRVFSLMHTVGLVHRKRKPKQRASSAGAKSSGAQTVDVSIEDQAATVLEREGANDPA